MSKTATDTETPNDTNAEVTSAQGELQPKVSDQVNASQSDSLSDKTVEKSDVASSDNSVENIEAQALPESSPKPIKGIDQVAVAQLIEQTKNIQCELEKLNDHKLIHTYNSIPRFLWFSLLKGISLGLGSVLGATVVLSALVYVLSQMEFIPIIGEWISAILEVVKQNPEN